MLKVGLTGAIGCGKTTVGQMLAALGAHVTQADAIARELLRPGQPVYDEVVRRFGCDILHPDGIIDRKKLADAAFGTPDHPSARVQELNNIVHPAVARSQDGWMTDIGNADPEAVVVVEAALILEAGMQKQFDRIVVVTCPPEARVRRWMLRNQVDEVSARRELERRMAAQWPEENKVAAADFVIDNSGSTVDTEAQVGDMFARLKQEAVERAR
jgi:dephospho-CoA kinase